MPSLSYSSGGRDITVPALNGFDGVNSPLSKFESTGGAFNLADSNMRSKFFEVLGNWLQSAMQSFDTNALAAANRAADRTNAFNASQAELNRRFQQQSAQSAMQFEADQAALDREFQQQSILHQQAYNSAEAEKNRLFQQDSANAAMEFEAQQAREAMAYSERMANTTYQRAISDLKAAGLSPLLAYGNLQTSSPQGVMASSSAASGSSASSAAASGRAASGRAASGSAASGVKPDTNSALDVDRKSLQSLMSMLTLNVTSALKSNDQLVKLVDTIWPF